MEIHLRTTGCRSPYGITQYYLPPDTSEHTQPQVNPSQCRLVLDLPTTEGWKAELTWVAGYMPRWFTCPQTVTHPSIYRARSRVTTLIETDALPLSQATTVVGWP